MSQIYNQENMLFLTIKTKSSSSILLTRALITCVPGVVDDVVALEVDILMKLSIYSSNKENNLLLTCANFSDPSITPYNF